MIIDTRGAPKFFKPSPLPPPSVTPGFYEAPRAEAIVKAAPRVLFAKQGSQPNTGGSKSPERSVFVTTSGISPGPDSYDSLRSLNSSSKTPPTVAYSMGAGSILRTDWTKLSPDTPGPGSCLSAGFCQKDIGYITKYVKPKAAFFSRSERFVNPKVHTK